MSNSVLYDKSKKFAKAVVTLTRQVAKVYGERNMTNQLKRSGTSIGANLAEAQYAESPDDFIHKLRVSLKEAKESEYWIEILWSTGYLPDDVYRAATHDVQVIIRMLVSSINTTRTNKTNKKEKK